MLVHTHSLHPCPHPQRHDTRSRHSSLRQGDRRSPKQSRREGSAKRSLTRSSFVDEEENPFLPKRGAEDGRNSVAPSHHSSVTGGMSDRTRQRRRAEKQPEGRSGTKEPLAREPDEAISAWIQNNLPAVILQNGIWSKCHESYELYTG